MKPAMIPQVKGGAVTDFDFIMIKPSHYDDDGYPIVWWRTILPSNSLAALNGRLTRTTTGSCVDM